MVKLQGFVSALRKDNFIFLNSIYYLLNTFLYKYIFQHVRNVISLKLS